MAVRVLQSQCGSSEVVRTVDTSYCVSFTHDLLGYCRVDVQPPKKHVDEFILNSLEYFENLPGIKPGSVSFDFSKSLRQYQR